MESNLVEILSRGLQLVLQRVLPLARILGHCAFGMEKA
jgi:hypothetical protein